MIDPALSRREATGALVAAFAGTLAGALALPRSAQAARAAPDVIVAVENWSFNGARGRRIITPNFRLHTTTLDSDLLTRVPIFLELALTRYRTAFGDLPAPQGQLETYLMGTRSQWEAITRQLVGNQAQIYLRVERGGFAAGGKGVYYDIGDDDTVSIAAHEGWHQYTQSVFKDPLPIWLEEGIASWMEGFRFARHDANLPVFSPWANTSRHRDLVSAFTSRQFLPIAELFSRRPQDLLATDRSRALSYYAQGWALVHFLHEGEGGKYRQPLHTMLQDAAAGRLRAKLEQTVGRREASIAMRFRVGPGAALAYLSRDLDAMETEYKRFLARAIRPGSRDKVRRGQSPVP
ncbi:MAG: hypothetical protein AAF995_02675 [Planctomycetota bacterium]